MKKDRQMSRLGAGSSACFLLNLAAENRESETVGLLYRKLFFIAQNGAVLLRFTGMWIKKGLFYGRQRSRCAKVSTGKSKR